MTDTSDDRPTPEASGPIIPGEAEAPDTSAGAENARLPPSAARAPEPEAGFSPTETRAGAADTAGPPARQRRGGLTAILGVVGFVILAGAIVYLWVRPVPAPALPAMPPNESGAVTALNATVGTLRGQVATLKSELAALDAREKADVSGLHAAIAAIPPPPKAAPAAAVAQAKPAAAQPDAALQTQLAGLSGRLDQVASAEAAQAKQMQSLPSAGDLAKLSTRIGDLAQRQQTQSRSLASAADLAKLSTRVDDLAQQQSKQNDGLQQTLTHVQQQLTSLSGQTETLSQSAQALPQLTQKADRLSEILRAQVALRAGMPLGAINGAPSSLARFAKTAPPTDAALRVSFPAAAKAAEAAGEPRPDQGRFWHRVWLRVQDLVTVRQGDRVIVGDPTGAILAHAQRLLDAGDLGGALTVMGTLSGPAAQAMASWEAEARALLAAQQALAKMAAG